MVQYKNHPDFPTEHLDNYVILNRCVLLSVKVMDYGIGKTL